MTETPRRAGPSTPKRAAAASGRTSGRPLSPDDRGVPDDPVPAAREICLRQLSMGPRTKAQLAFALARRGVDENVAERVLERLSEVGLIDDAAFAAEWVESRHSGRGLSRRALAHELRRRGIPDPLVDGALAELAPEREMATARELAVRRLAGCRGLDPPIRFRRAAAALARKGYSEAVAYRVIREVLEAEAEAAGLPPSGDALPEFGSPDG